MKHILHKTVLILFTIAGSLPAYSEECYEKSPNIINNENSYFDLVVKEKLTRDEAKKLNSINESLAGKWSGKAVVVECVGSERNSKTRTTKSKVTAIIHKGNKNEMIVKSELYVKAKKITKNTSLYLFRSDNMFNVDIPVENNITYGEKYRKKIRNGTQFLETINSILINDDKLSLKLNHYMNGVLIAYEKWTLARKIKRK